MTLTSKSWWLLHLKDADLHSHQLSTPPPLLLLQQLQTSFECMGIGPHDTVAPSTVTMDVYLWKAWY
jgi:hypothetical protein